MSRTCLYIETNFLIGHAKGEAPDAFEFLSQARKVSAETEFVIPEICLMEAFHALKTQRRSRDRDFKLFEQSPLLKDLRKGKGDERSEAIIRGVEQLSLNTRGYLDTQQRRLLSLTSEIARTFRLISLNPTSLIERIRERATETDWADELILSCILDDAHQNPAPNKVFLSGNIRDFGAAEITTHLKANGVQYFGRSSDLLSWIEHLRPDS